MRLAKVYRGGIIMCIKGNDMKPLGLFITRLFMEAGWKVRQGNDSQVPWETGICILYYLEGKEIDEWLALEPKTTIGILVTKLGFSARSPLSYEFMDRDGAGILLCPILRKHMNYAKW